MITRRSILVGIGGIVLASGAWTVGAYCASMAGTDAGVLEYAVAGQGPTRRSLGRPYRRRSG
jgi:hypothetical protein